MFYVDTSEPPKVVTESQVIGNWRFNSLFGFDAKELRIKSKYKNGRGNFEVQVENFFPTTIGKTKGLIEFLQDSDDANSTKQNIEIISNYLFRRIVANKNTMGCDPKGVTGYKQICKNYEAIRKYEREVLK